MDESELRCTALAMAVRSLTKRATGCSEMFTVEDVRVAAQCFYDFLTNDQHAIARLGLAPADIVPKREKTPEEFRQSFGEQAWKDL